METCSALLTEADQSLRNRNCLGTESVNGSELSMSKGEDAQLSPASLSQSHT